MSVSNEQIYSKVLISKIIEHKKMFGIPDNPSDLMLMPLSEYKKMVNSEAYFYVDHNGFLRHQYSGEVLAVSKEQLNIIIEMLQSKIRILDDAMDCVKE